MPRQARKNLKTPYLHIIVQGINKEYIFEDNYLKKLYISLLKKQLKENEMLNLNILAYCIMDNHAHLLIYSPKIEDTSIFMHKLNTNFARKYNRLKNHIGYVFRDRFFVQPITSERQLFNCLVYIHKNPISANIVNNYEDYLFSSYTEFIKKFHIITSESCKIIFGTSENYFDTFKKIHKDRIIDDIKDISKHMDPNQVIVAFIKHTGQNLDSIKKDKLLFKELLFQLQEKSSLSMRKLSTLLKVSRYTLLKILN